MKLRGLNEENKYLKRQIKEVQAINSQATKDLVESHDKLIGLKRQNKELLQALNVENQSQSQSIVNVASNKSAKHVFDVGEGGSEFFASVHEYIDVKKLHKQIAILKKSNQ